MSCEPAAFASAVQAFVYQDFGAGDVTGIPVDISIFEHAAPPKGKPGVAPVAVSEMESKQRVTAAYERGFADGRKDAEADAERRVAEARQLVAETLKGFADEREQYFRAMEGEVVNLALAVARKILYREAQVDRVVLAGVVRVAMEKLSGSGKVSLCVHPSSAEAWRQHLSAQQLPVAPEIVEDASIPPQQLVLKTPHGSTSLGLDTQFTEIERGFSDLVQQRQRSLQP